MRPATFDRDRYCQRIQYEGSVAADERVLRALMRHHMAAIPFENLDVLLDVGIDIGADAIMNKLVTRGRGGYCFEQNGLFKLALDDFGFEVQCLAARVLWRLPSHDAPRPRTHMVLLVRLNGKDWLVDVGFGGYGPTEPLCLSDESPQTMLYSAFRVSSCATESLIEIHVDGAWEPVYEVQSLPLAAADWEPLNWFTSTHPRSVFRRDLMVALTTPTARHTLLNSKLTTRTPGGEVTQVRLDAKGLELALTAIFKLPEDPVRGPLLLRVADQKIINDN